MKRLERIEGKPGQYLDAEDGKKCAIMRSFTSVLMIPSNGLELKFTGGSTFLVQAVLARMKPPYPEAVLSLCVNQTRVYEVPLPELCTAHDNLNNIMNLLKYPDFKIEDFLFDPAEKVEERAEKMEKLATALLSVVKALSGPILSTQPIELRNSPEGIDHIEARTQPQVPLALIYLIGKMIVPA